ncbi:hypothetical protein GCM10023197_37870 [Gordonia humi]
MRRDALIASADVVRAGVRVVASTASVVVLAVGAARSVDRGRAVIVSVVVAVTVTVLGIAAVPVSLPHDATPSAAKAAANTEAAHRIGRFIMAAPSVGGAIDGVTSPGKW